ncbi:hypothetical protein [Natronobacterium texcoconense]|uniref:Type I restriction enzyme R protein N-terminal domain-containing protein n=1 Tax=Natronobacterium texcoconense TaxID=1095778 RepID=A0A1H1B5J6_NATTX|nr:hypothetical protein [Natronobacterium texcoconense]SDQ47214.1 hypothetical protein SAMN04489842_0932 [Natronobacterium texcoconense]
MTDSRPDPVDLRSFVARSRAVVDASSPVTAEETCRWLVEPLLEALGWDVRDDCTTDGSVAQTRLEYVLSVDGVPAVFVAVESTDDSLAASRANGIREAMARTGVDRAIYTNGLDYLFLAGTTEDEAERLACRLPALAEYESALAYYSRPVLAERFERADRSFVARQLAVERTTLADAITDELNRVVDGADAYADEFESATDRLLTELLETVSNGTAQSGTTLTFEEASSTPDATRDSESETPSSATSQGSEGDENDKYSEDDEDGEYVVRFFNDRGSIGAIGHSSSEQALVATAEYLFERGLSGVSLPWSPDDDAPTVLNDDPIRADGTPMAAPRELSNGRSLETAGDVSTRAKRAKALAARAGLRAMLTGDWSDEAQ